MPGLGTSIVDALTHTLSYEFVGRVAQSAKRLACMMIYRLYHAVECKFHQVLQTLLLDVLRDRAGVVSATADR